MGTRWISLAALAVLASTGCKSKTETVAPADEATKQPAPAATAEPPPAEPAAPAAEARPTGDAPAAPPPGRVSDAAEPDATDLLTLAQGAIPLRVEGTGTAHRAALEQAIKAVDGNTTPYAMASHAPADVATEFIYELPAPTTFRRLAVPNIREVPSKFQTFSRTVEVLGSSKGPDDGYTLLASATLATHPKRDQLTELTIHATIPVRWVKLRLAGGILVDAEKTTFDFSEIIGNGDQEPRPMSDRFTGTWREKGVQLQLKQDGPLVIGCYDDRSELNGTLTGNILHARGVADANQIVSLFILSVSADGALRGVRSTNGAPFKAYASPATPGAKPLSCPKFAPPKLGCGSLIHGIQFAYNSAEIRPESESVLAKLHDGLKDDPAASILITGHTSSEGKPAYNLELSKKRAQSVVDDLTRRGIAKKRLAASGKGASAPIAKNDDEAGRSLNRRVEVTCN